MAEVVTEPPAPTPPQDWSPYADGQMWKLRRGVDFHAGQSAQQARRSFIQWANRRGWHTRTSVIDADTVLLRCYPGTGG